MAFWADAGAGLSPRRQNSPSLSGRLPDRNAPGTGRRVLALRPHAARLLVIMISTAASQGRSTAGTERPPAGAFDSVPRSPAFCSLSRPFPVPAARKFRRSRHHGAQSPPPGASPVSGPLAVHVPSAFLPASLPSVLPPAFPSLTLVGSRSAGLPSVSAACRFTGFRPHRHDKRVQEKSPPAASPVSGPLSAAAGFRHRRLRCFRDALPSPGRRTAPMIFPYRCVAGECPENGPGCLASKKWDGVHRASGPAGCVVKAEAACRPVWFMPAAGWICRDEIPWSGVMKRFGTGKELCVSAEIV